MNACCGHGVTAEAYVQYWNGTRIAGKAALFEMRHRSEAAAMEVNP